MTSVTDLDEVVNTPQVPLDAGEYADAFAAMLERVPYGEGHWLGCDLGWYRIVAELDAHLTELDPGYVLHEATERLGVLSFRFEPSPAASVETASRMRDLVDQAEAASSRTCELTGRPGVLMRTAGGWFKTLDPVTAPAHYVDVVDEFSFGGDLACDICEGEAGELARLARMRADDVTNLRAVIANLRAELLARPSAGDPGWDY